MNNDAELTMREEQWMLAQELLAPARPEPPLVIAFKLLDEQRWEEFLTEIDGNAALRFFNPELREFSCAADWEKLAEEYGVTPYEDVWRIDPSMNENVRQFCRELRAAARDLHMPTAGRRLFQRMLGGLLVDHNCNCLTRYFDVNCGEFQLASEMLSRRRLYRTPPHIGFTFIHTTQ